MAYVTSEARQQLLDEVAQAIDRLAIALAAVGAAYEALDEQAGDRLEEQLFRPLQVAYGRAKRTHAGFAERHGLQGREFAPGTSRSSHGLQEQIEDAIDAMSGADDLLSELQDSMLPGRGRRRRGASRPRRGARAPHPAPGARARDVAALRPLSGLNFNCGWVGKEGVPASSAGAWALSYRQGAAAKSGPPLRWAVFRSDSGHDPAHPARAGLATPLPSRT